MSDHVSDVSRERNGPALEALTTAAALAGRVPGKWVLGVAASNTFRHPALLAEGRHAPRHDHRGPLHPRPIEGRRSSRVLVTGGSGFVGSRLVERLRRQGHEVSIARRRDYDLTSMEATRRLFDDTAPDSVFHLAAEVGGIGQPANPGRYW